MELEMPSPSRLSRLAYMRFGLGPRGATGATLAMTQNSARDALLAEIANPNVAMPDPLFKTPNGSTVALTAETCGSFGTQVVPGMTPSASTVLDAERCERYVKWLAPDIGFAERMVMFWNNHFSIYPKGGLGTVTTGLMERTVLRPNVFGRFHDMLKGVVQSPAMLVFLDNTSNIGPRSKTGRRYRKTYNENLAREILELHTVGVGAQYTPDDVTNFSKILAGWTVGNGRSARPGRFLYDQDCHEPGAYTIMGKLYGQADGLRQSTSVLHDLAYHPSTAQHIAYKLLRHFVTEDPTPDMVSRLAHVFNRTGGDLAAVSTALVTMPEAWTAPMNRMRPPLLYTMSLYRAMNVSEDSMRQNAWKVGAGLKFLGNALWDRLTPDGYQEENFLWENPDLLRCMADGARMMGESIGNPTWTQRPHVFADMLFPGEFSSAVKDVISAQTDDRKALALLFMTPEFLRR